ncbi:hypothetical protein [Roseibacillus persicicus]|uniref:Uncharacterized protein n=1 Tax=Roseibacillus persicicus TaxID=454148 RepID=A0A918WKF0_9BACT|nr:hypothetical protein [Roseibacillus persicicus]MDQ8189975.1 hypothetical protein [Roseibacillus persicicus]GHC51044.1 hypothetical protein GCM10007100_16510 [Roseibacillus persicicus]
MTSRERNLLILLVVMAFLVVNFLAYRVWYAPKMAEMQATMESAEQKAEANEGMGAVLDAVAKDQEWLNRFEPKPTSEGKMKTRMQQLASNEAVRAGLKIKKEGFVDGVIDPNLHYHRARYDMEVNGTEASIYRWLDRLHNPNEFRVVTFVKLEPQRDDAERADCRIYLDQWFVPEGDQI